MLHGSFTWLETSGSDEFLNVDQALVENWEFCLIVNEVGITLSEAYYYA